MRWFFPSFIVVLSCVMLVSVSRAQTTSTQEITKQNIEYAKKSIQSVSLNETTTASSLPEVTLKSYPISCATLRKGQPCFVKFSMSWESDQPITVCLISDQNDAGACWDDAQSGRFRKDLYLSETTTWHLETLQGLTLGQVKVSVAWVYKSGRVRRNWSLF